MPGEVNEFLRMRATPDRSRHGDLEAPAQVVVCFNGRAKGTTAAATKLTRRAPWSIRALPRGARTAPPSDTPVAVIEKALARFTRTSGTEGR